MVEIVAFYKKKYWTSSNPPGSNPQFVPDLRRLLRFYAETDCTPQDLIIIAAKGVLSATLDPKAMRFS